jgi:adenosylcobinamide-phosphate synthase
MSWDGMAEAALALALEALLGYPAWLYRRAGHPVGWIARVIEGLSDALNRPGWPDWRRRLGGVATATIVAACGAGFGVALRRLAERSGAPALVTAVLATPGLAQRSLYDHVSAVRGSLARGDLGAARTAVARIVGRDVGALDASGMSTAALESLAESFNDGVAAPAFWLAMAGLPGLYAYKALNTADSLIGHREPPWRHFGWAAARADDLANLIPARLAGALIALAGGGGWRTMQRDAPKHASPNAGWPEAAMAGALGVRLGGPASYDGVPAHRPVFGADFPLAGPRDLSRGLAVYQGACVLLVVGIAALGFARRRRG